MAEHDLDSISVQHLVTAVEAYTQWHRNSMSGLFNDRKLRRTIWKTGHHAIGEWEGR
jgi:hypothetical protein